jgi:hypothetical protein
MSEKYRFHPDPSINHATVLPSSTLSVYASKAVPGAMTMTMSHPSVIKGGTRLTEEQAGDLIGAIFDIFPGLEEKRVKELSDTYDAGYVAGQWDGTTGEAA